MITTPYFIPDGALLLQAAADRRAAAASRCISSSPRWRTSSWSACASESYYDELLGGRRHDPSLPQHFLHAKHLSIDDHVALIGSSNMDIRSFARNPEITLLVYHPALAERIRLEEART